MRQRDLKPGFFDNPELSECGVEAQLLFAGLWCYADREGRCKDEPRRIRAHVFPYYPHIDAAPLLDALEVARFIIRYVVDGERYIWIPTFSEHQHCHPREAPSKFPAFEGSAKDMPRTDLDESITGGTSGPSCPSDPSGLSDKSAAREISPSKFAKMPDCFNAYPKSTVEVSGPTDMRHYPAGILAMFESAFGMPSQTDLGEFWQHVHDGCLPNCEHSYGQVTWCTCHIMQKIEQKATQSWKTSRILKRALREDRQEYKPCPTR